MAGVLAVSYGSNARPIYGEGDVRAVSAPEGARLVPGAVGAMEGAHCAATKEDGTPCGARPAKGTELCAGHLRAEGRL